jgi:hypothetical protein
MIHQGAIIFKKCTIIVHKMYFCSHKLGYGAPDTTIPEIA